MPEKDPQTYTLLQYVWVFGLALWGGAVSYYQRCRKDGKRFDFLVLTGELSTSALSGLLAFYLCESQDMSGLHTAVVVAIAGHAGGEVLQLIDKFMRRRFGLAGVVADTKDEAGRK